MNGTDHRRPRPAVKGLQAALIIIAAVAAYYVFVYVLLGL
jgi:hypothetical protein